MITGAPIFREHHYPYEKASNPDFPAATLPTASGFSFVSQDIHDNILFLKTLIKIILQIRKAVMELVLILLGIFSSSFLVALSGALMPGPLLTYTVAEAARRGFWVGPVIILGHGVLELGLLILLLLGIGAIINQPLIMGVIALAGACILFWLGYELFTSARHARLSFDAEDVKTLSPFWAGIIMSLSNPYWLIWWVTLGLGYVLFASQYGLWGVVFFYVGHILADLGWYSLVSLAVAQGKKFISDRVYHGFMVVCALFLMIFGCYFGYQGVKTLVGA